MPLSNQLLLIFLFWILAMILISGGIGIYAKIKADNDLEGFAQHCAYGMMAIALVYMLVCIILKIILS